MSTLTKEMIRRVATNDLVFARGVQYFKKSAVSNVSYSKTKKVYYADVMGNHRYNVILDINDENNIRYTCNCPAKVKQVGACKHVVAAMMFLEHYFDQAKLRKMESSGEKNALQIINYFNEQTVPAVVPREFFLKASIRIPAMVKKDDFGLDVAGYLSLSAGTHRLYKIQHLKKFLTDYMEQKPIQLGKDFVFVAEECRFHHVSEKILSYLLDILEMQRIFEKGISGSSSVYKKSELVLTKNMLIKLLRLLGKSFFQLDLFGTEYNNVQFVEGNPDVVFEIKSEKSALLFDFAEDHPITAISEDGRILFREQKIYLPDKDFIIHYLPFYNSLGKDKAPLRFDGKLKNGFMESVLPQLAHTMEIIIPKELEDHYIKEPLSIEFYLDREENDIIGRLEFVYGKARINPLDSKPLDYVVIRDTIKEEEFIDHLYDIGFIRNKNSFLLKKEEQIYEFLSRDMMELSAQCRLYYSDDFKKMKIHSHGSINSSVRYSLDLKLYEVNLSFDEIPAEDLKELFASLKLQKKYHRIKNGDFIDLSAKEFSIPLELLELLNLDDSMVEGNVLFLREYQVPFVESYLKNRDNVNFTSDSHYQNLMRRLTGNETLHYEVPEVITATLRNYQVTGYQWLCMLSDYEMGGILADDMGLGKTIQSICYIAYRAEQKKGRSFVVCPTSLIYNWQEEFEKFAPTLKTKVIIGTPEERSRLIETSKEDEILITSYPLLRKDIACYEQMEFDHMFIDEAQFIKNPKSLNARSVKAVRAKHRFALTGTPIENSLSELWSIFDFLMPSFLFHHNKFVNLYEKPIMRDENQERMQDLSAKIRPFILRRMKKEVLEELPDKVETNIVTDMTEEQRKVYLSYLQESRELFDDEFLKEEDAKDTPVNRIKILSVLTRLRQICCHPSTFIENYHGDSGKLETLMELVEQTLESNHRMLIFSQFTSMLKIIEERLNQQGISYFYLDGSTDPSKRMEYAKRFNDGEKNVFLISLKAGGTGLNLTGADTVIHYDPWWNPAVEDQASDRAYRIGQESKVQVFKLVTKNSIEEKILKLKEKKKELSDSVILSDEVFLNKLTKEELRELFS